jgi:putative DNA primase/helicase
MNLESVLARVDRPRRCGNGYVAYCPSHEDRHRSLSIRGVDKRILLHCFADCEFWDIVAALGIRAADLRTDAVVKQAGIFTEDRIHYARRLWQSTRPIRGTIAAKYLGEARGIIGVLPRCLRFLPLLKHLEYGWQFPCLCAGIQAPDGAFGGMSLTWLCADGTDKAPVDPTRKIFGALRGGAVRLGPTREVMVVCEGVETGLSVAQSCPKLPVWCALSASNLARVELPTIAHEVIVAADADAAGEAAAQAAAQRFLREGRVVRIARPDGGKDFNDMRI